MGKKRKAEDALAPTEQVAADVEAAEPHADLPSNMQTQTGIAATGGKRKGQRKPKSQQSQPEYVVADSGVGQEGGEVAEAGGEGAAIEEGQGSGRRRERWSEVPPETLSYLKDIITHFKTLVDDEEKQLLVGNVLEEIAGKELVLASDGDCSRYLELLLGSAQPQQLLQFLTSACAEDALLMLAAGPFGSHVVEKALVRLDTGMASLEEADYTTAEQLIETMVTSLCEHLYEFITDRFATHVARRLLCVLAGRDVLPAASKAQQAASAKTGKAAGGPHGGLLASRTSGSSSGPNNMSAAVAAAAAAPPRYPDHLTRLVTAATGDAFQGQGMEELIAHPYASPFLQGLLTACAGDRAALHQLVPAVLCTTYFDDAPKAGKVLAGVDAERMSALMMDATASRLVEVVVGVAHKSLSDELHERFLKGQLLSLAHHPSANFVVQAALAAASGKDQVKWMFEELRPVMGDLLRKRRSGVVAALVAACGRAGACQKEVCATLATALSGSSQGAGAASLASALLCLDTSAAVGFNLAPATNAPAPPRLSTLGATMLSNILSWGQGSCRDFTDSVAAMQHHDAVRVARDPSGSRALEAFLNGSAPVPVKVRLLASLKGGYAAVASTAPGSYVVEAAYAAADMETREQIVSELSAASRTLELTHWGPSLLRKLGSQAYLRDPEQWQRHATSSTKTLAQFAELFADDDGGGGKSGKRGGGDARGGLGGNKRTRREEDAAAAVVDGGFQDSAAGEEGGVAVQTGFGGFAEGEGQEGGDGEEATGKLNKLQKRELKRQRKAAAAAAAVAVAAAGGAASAGVPDDDRGVGGGGEDNVAPEAVVESGAGVEAAAAAADKKRAPKKAKRLAAQQQ